MISTLRRIVRAVQAKQVARDSERPVIPVHDLPVLVVDTTRRIVETQSLNRRAQHSVHPVRYLAHRTVFEARMPYYKGFLTAVEPVVPLSMSRAFDHALRALEETAAGRA